MTRPLGWQGLPEALEYGSDLMVGERVRLRAMTDADLAVLEQWWDDPRVSLLNRREIRPRPPGGHLERFRGWSSNEPDGTAVGFSVETLDDGQFAGHVGLFAISRKDRSAEFGIVLGPPFWSQGLGSDATRLTVRYGFDELNLHRIHLQAFAFNARALAAYEKAGFRPEGRRRDVVWHGGRWHDDVVMAVLEDEWRALTARRST